MAFEARQRQAEFAAQQRADAEEYARRIAEAEAEADERRRKTAVEERIAAQVQALTDLQWHLQGLPNAAQSLQDAINQVCADEWLWPYHFHRVAATGNYTARFAIETAPSVARFITTTGVGTSASSRRVAKRSLGTTSPTIPRLRPLRQPATCSAASCQGGPSKSWRA